MGLDAQRKVVVYALRVGGVLEASGPEVAYPLRISPVQKLEYFQVSCLLAGLS